MRRAATGPVATLALCALVALTASACGFGDRKREEQVRRDWSERLGGATFPERFPARAANATALELERLTAQVGLDLAPFEAPERPHPNKELAERWYAFSERIRSYLLAIDKHPGEPAAPPDSDLDSALGAARPTLDSIVRLLAESEPPEWEIGLPPSLDAQEPNLAAALGLHRWLLVEASEALRLGDRERAHRALEVAWTFAGAIRRDPNLFAQTIGITMVKQQLPLLPRFCDSLPVWEERLASLDLRRGVLIAYDFQTYRHLEQSKLDTSDRVANSDGHGWGSRFALWSMRDFAYRQHAIFREVEKEDVLELDPEAFHDLHERALPRWNVFRWMLLPSWDDLPVAARTEAAAEGTLLALRFGAAEPRARREGWPRPSTRLPGLSWNRVEDEQGEWLVADRDFRYQTRLALPLRFPLDSPGCTSR